LGGQRGYSFSLADGASAELLSQHAREAITDVEFDKKVGALETFLNPEFVSFWVKGHHELDQRFAPRHTGGTVTMKMWDNRR